MKKKVIVFGLGNRYREYKKRIINEFEPIAYTSNDRNDEKNCDGHYINPSEIKDYIFDYILICCDSDVEIFNQLVNELGITSNRIRTYREVFSVDGLFHSEHYEDAIALFLLEKIGMIPKDCYYLDLGANHPILGNNTYFLYKLGAKGVLVEANPELSGFIKYLRPRDVLIDKAVTLNGENATLYRTRISGHSTIEYDKLVDDVKNNSNLWDVDHTYNVEGITTNEIISGLNRSIDLMSIDIEGMDMAVLRQMDFRRFRPSIVIAETRAFAFAEYGESDYHVFFDSNDYELFHQTEANGIYVDSKYNDLLRDYEYYKWAKE